MSPTLLVFAAIFVVLAFVLPKRLKAGAQRRSQRRLASSVAPLHVEISDGGAAIAAHPAQMVAMQANAARVEHDASGIDQDPNQMSDGRAQPIATTNASIVASLTRLLRRGARQKAPQQPNFASTTQTATLPESDPNVEHIVPTRKGIRFPFIRLGRARPIASAQHAHNESSAKTTAQPNVNDDPIVAALPVAESIVDAPIDSANGPAPTPEPPADETPGPTAAPTPEPLGTVDDDHHVSDELFGELSLNVDAPTAWQRILDEAFAIGASAIYLTPLEDHGIVKLGTGYDVIASSNVENLALDRYDELLELIERQAEVQPSADAIRYGRAKIDREETSYAFDVDFMLDASGHQRAAIHIVPWPAEDAAAPERLRTTDETSDLDRLFEEKDAPTSADALDGHPSDRTTSPPNLTRTSSEDETSAPADFSGVPGLDDDARRKIIEEIESGESDETEPFEELEDEETRLPTYGWLAFAGEAAQTMDVAQRQQTVLMLRNLHEPWCLNVLCAAADEESPDELRPAVVEALAYAFPEAPALKPIYERLLHDTAATEAERAIAARALDRL